MDVIPTIRTSPQSARREMHDGNSTIRIIVKLLRELVTRQRFTEYSDVKHALRRRLSALKIRYRQEEFDDAYPIVASNVRLVQSPAAPVLKREPIEANLNLSKFDAAEAMAQIRNRLKVTPVVRSMPTPAYVSRRQAECERAMRMIESEMLASLTRCDALEREK